MCGNLPAVRTGMKALSYVVLCLYGVGGALIKR